MKILSPAWFEDRLKKIATVLIEAHRTGNHACIDHYAARVMPQAATSDTQPRKRVFMKLMQVYHPDRLGVYLRTVSGYEAAGNSAALAKLERLLEFKAITPRRVVVPLDESYSYDQDDFGYGEETPESDGWDSEPIDPVDDQFAEGTFMEALKREFFGNLELYPSSAEIEQLEGELDLSDFGIQDLSGAEMCINLSGLNLSTNQIDNVWPLRGLANLEFLDLSSNELEAADELSGLFRVKELDLSFNQIDDMAFLLRLESLVCVSIIGNPVRDKSVAERLKKRGVLVIC